MNILTHSKKTILNISLLCVSALYLSGCVAPLVIGGGATVGTLATREKGVTGTLSDSQISVLIKAKHYGFDPNMHAAVGVNVQNAEALLTGNVSNQEWIVEAERLAWQVKGVKKVLNNIALDENTSITDAIGTTTKDSWITTQIKSKILFGDNIRSLNYSIKTVNHIVYVMGIAQNKAELEQVLEIASKVSGVKKVVDYTRINEESETASNDESTETLNEADSS